MFQKSSNNVIIIHVFSVRFFLLGNIHYICTHTNHITYLCVGIENCSPDDTVRIHVVSISYETLEIFIPFFISFFLHSSLFIMSFEAEREDRKWVLTSSHGMIAFLYYLLNFEKRGISQIRRLRKPIFLFFKSESIYTE